MKVTTLALPAMLAMLANADDATSQLIGKSRLQTRTNRISSLAMDRFGSVRLTEDGVLRSWAANGTVIDYKALTNAEIMEVLTQRPGASANDPLKVVYKNVDGTNVPEADILSPEGINYPAQALETARKQPPISKRDLAGLDERTYDPYCASPYCTS